MGGGRALLCVGMQSWVRRQVGAWLAIFYKFVFSFTHSAANSDQKMEKCNIYKRQRYIEKGGLIYKINYARRELEAVKFKLQWSCL